MSERAIILAIITLVVGSFVASWVWGGIVGNPWPIIGWFMVAIALAAAGG